MQGKIIKHAGGFAFESISTDYSRPDQIRHVWAIPHYCTSGMSYCTEDDAIGREAKIVDGRVSCYLGNGNWFKGELEKLGSTRAILVEVTPIARPARIKSETRWYAGRWQKYSQRQGWIAA